MNIGFPKAQHDVAAFCEIGITLSVTGNILHLDWCKAFIFAGFAMPEVTIPLDNRASFREQHINQELPANRLLFHVDNAERIQDSTSSNLKRRVERKYVSISDTPKNARIAAPVRAIVQFPNIRWGTTKPPSADGANKPNAQAFANQRTVKCLGSQAGSRAIDSFATGSASYPQALPSLCYLLFAVMINAFRRLLPLVSTSHRTKAQITVSARVIVVPAPLAHMSTTSVTPFGKVTSWGKCDSALAANLEVGDILHAHIIPWRVALCKSS